MAKLVEKYIHVGPWLTESLSLAAVGTSPALQVVIIPGNPGSARFYTYLMEKVHKLFDGEADVTAISHLGHDRDSFDPTQVCLVQEGDQQLHSLEKILHCHLHRAGVVP
jgi:hypothetical protein